MARTHSISGNESLSKASVLISSFPCTFACWCKPTSIALDGNQNYTLMSFDDAGGDNQVLLWMEDNGASNSIIAAVVNSNVIVRAQSSQPTAGSWHHACAVFASTTSRSCYVNGANKATGTDSANFPSGLDTTYIGFSTRTSGAHFDGDIAEAAMWDVALTDAEVRSLGLAGVVPTLVRPQSLVSYWPIYGNASPEPDRWKNRNDMTLNNSPAKANHPRIYRPHSGAF